MAGPALIAGGGIAGLTLALALARRGKPSQIVERASALEATGAGVQLSPNAGRVLDALGLGPALDAVATRPEAVSIVDAPSGRRLKRITLGPSAERRWGAAYRVLHRADLQSVLLDAIEQAGGVEITLGAEARAVAETGTGVALEIAHATGGGETLHGTWLAGADGLRSLVRRAVKLPTALGGSGLKAWRAVLPAAALPTAFDMSEVTLWLGPGAHLVVYPVRRGREANVVVIGDDRADGPAALAASWASPARELIAAAPGWTPWPLHDRPPDARMHRGRIALLGDASHAALPSLAQGAGFAIEDAAVLARLVCSDPRDPFAAYQEARLMRVARMQSAARRQIRVDHLKGLAATARNAALTLAPDAALLRGLDWIYGWRDAG
jgi:salicylate hydroxylase